MTQSVAPGEDICPIFMGKVITWDGPERDQIAPARIRSVFKNVSRPNPVPHGCNVCGRPTPYVVGGVPGIYAWRICWKHLGEKGIRQVRKLFD